MKTINFSIGAAALASLVLISCSKEQELQIGNQEDNPVEMVTLKFKAEKAGADTKTSANIDAVNNKVSYTWTDEDEDNITVYLVDGSDLTPVTAVVSKTSDTQLSIIAEVPKADSYTIRAVLAREFYAKGKPMVSKYQSPADDNFDPYGDILFSDDKDIVTTGDLTDELLLTFNRKVSVNKMTLRSLGAGEKVSKVEISSDKDLVGYFDGTDLVPVADSKKIVLSYDNVTVPASGEFPVYFTCMEMAGHTLTVTVTTDAKTYTKTFGAGGINFALGKFLTFGVTMPAGEVPSDTWELVKSTSAALSDGDVVYIANLGGTYAMGSQNGTYRSQVAATPISGGEQITPNASFQEITLEAISTNFYLNTDASNCLYASSSSSNNIGTGTKTAAGDNGKWSISVDADGVATIVAQGANTHNQLRYNSSSTRFSCYTSTSDLAKPVLYRKVSADPTVWNLKSIVVTTAPDKKEYSDGDAFDPTGMVVAATYEDNAGTKPDKVEIISNSLLTVSPTLLSAGETKVALSFLNKTVDVTGLEVSAHVNKWNIVSSLSGIKAGKYTIAAYNSSKYYTVPNTTISGQTFTCTEATYSVSDGLTPPSGAGEFIFTAKDGTENAFYIYNTNLKKYLVATGSKSFGYVTDSSSDYGYWTFSEVAGGGFSGVFSVQHSSKTHYMRAYTNTVKCYDGASNSGIYLFIYE